LLASEAGNFITGVVLVVDGGALADATTDHFLQAKWPSFPFVSCVGHPHRRIEAARPPSKSQKTGGFF